MIGVGTGSTVDAAIAQIAQRIKTEGLVVSIVPTSYQSAWACTAAGLTVLSPTYEAELDWGFDGADAVDRQGNAIKGKGAAMLEEKILAAKCKSYFLIVDDSKVDSNICAKSYIPVECVPSSFGYVKRQLKSIGATELVLRDGRPGKHGPVITERGNVIVDATFPSFGVGLEAKIKSIVGVVESGLFEGFANYVLVATAAGAVETWNCK